MVIRLRSLLPDSFVLLLIGAIVVATVIPATGRALAIVGTISTAAIVLLFFFHGLRLSREAVIAGLMRWRLHLAILAFGYLLLPLIGLMLTPLGSAWLSPSLTLGILFLCVLPTTVQSSIAYSSIGRGNVAAAVVAAAASNIAGVVLTPLLFAAVAKAGGGGTDLSSIVKIATMLLLPFTLGQIARLWLAAWIERWRTVTSRLDRLTILLAVYVAFAQASEGGLWKQVSGIELALLAAFVLVLMLIAFAGAWGFGRALGFDRADRTTLLFCGAHKSLATGAPMARVLFPGPEAAAMLLPLIVYHQFQLIFSAFIAPRMGAGAAERAESPQTVGG
ncbi:MAG: Cytochrome oxidase [Alphaproteobacteria bacterium]|nr:Cytochrome oxidase [Alphaproteobacteria bacterium]